MPTQTTIAPTGILGGTSSTQNSPWASSFTQKSSYVERDPSLKGVDDWNREFALANYMPYDAKAEPVGWNNYLKTISKNRQDAIAASPMPAGWTGESTGYKLPTGTDLSTFQPAPGSNMGITPVNGLLTYADTASDATPNDYDPAKIQAEINRRLVLRGLPPQTGPGSTPGTSPAPGGTGTAPAPGTTPATGILGTPGYTAAQLGTPEKWNVDKNQTVAGQVEGIIAADSPLQQLARTRAMQQQNDRGTLNTSMAIQAAQAANLDAALPIAQADAALQGRAAAYNADTANQFAGKNVDATNTALNTTAGINANTARDTAQTLANKATAEQLALTNKAAAEQQAIVNKNAAFEKAAADLKQSTVNALNETDVAAFKANLASAGLGQEQSILVSRELTTNINAIQARTDIDGPTKTAYIQDAVKRTNETLAVIGRATKIAGSLLQFTDKPETQQQPTTNVDGTPTDGKPRIAGANGNPPATQSTFDSAAYYAANPDVANYYAGQPGGATPAQAWAHYSAAGRNEGRQAYLLAGGASTGPGWTG